MDKNTKTIIAEGGIELCSGRCFGRVFIVPCHRGRPNGDIQLNCLSEGRCDLVSRCISNTMFVSYGVRRNCEIRLPLISTSEAANEDPGGNTVARTVVVEGTRVKHLRPDERNIASLVKRSLQSHVLQTTGDGDQTNVDQRDSKQGTSAPPTTPAGFRIIEGGLQSAMLDFRQEVLERYCVGQPKSVLALVLSEEGLDIGDVLQKYRDEVLISQNESMGSEVVQPGDYHDRPLKHVVVFVGDDKGYTTKELECIHDEFTTYDVVEVSLGPVPLLASQCIVLIHHYLDKYLHHCTTKNSARVETRKWMAEQSTAS
eukprot:GFYU01021439.1.p1 GENE.GFYU01021439.1~~GFYU01021439.1.p1  ORF type:complete len:314 (-),score=42.39 GFYU01021439.1:141-1082(-)